LTRTKSIVFIVLRRMRAPLIVLTSVYAVAVAGLTLVPGVDANGAPAAPLSYFHAFYFVTYTATTIGYGEIPQPFSDAQRMWVIVCMYLVVVSWSYNIVAVLGLLQDKAFQNAIAERRFARQVRGLHEPFYLICGCGETGEILCRVFDRLEQRFVVIDLNELRIEELELLDFRGDAPTITGDARSPELLLAAGLGSRHCRGVIALTNDDEVNLAVAMSVRLLNPRVPVLCRVQSPQTAMHMTALGTNHIINPFETFAGYLALAMRAPGCYRLLDWLTSLPGAGLREEHEPPRGRWIVCGYGRFGRAITRVLSAQGLEVTIVDPVATELPEGRLIQGHGLDAASLAKAGIMQAKGLVAGTDNDVSNLSIAVTARQLNPRLFMVARQNLVKNAVLFKGFDPHLTMIPSEIVAHECVAILTTPLLARFLEIVRRREDAWADAVIDRLCGCVGEKAPLTWAVTMAPDDAPALHALLKSEGARLELLLRDGAARESRLACVALLLTRDDEDVILPGDDIELRPDDRLLFAGAWRAREMQLLTLRNENVLDYVLTGREASGGWLWRKLGVARDG